MVAGRAEDANDLRPARPHRTIADAPSLTALAHPTRLALIEAIAMSGALTATQASGIVGESPTACAYHLRTLAKLGFLEQADGGRGRERPWRLAQTRMSRDDDGDDPAVALAGRTLSTMLIERWIDRIRAFELARSRFPANVREVTEILESGVMATPAELKQLRTDISALMSRYWVDRTDPADQQPDCLPFEMVLFTRVVQIGELGSSSCAGSCGYVTRGFSYSGTSSPRWATPPSGSRWRSGSRS